MLFKILHFRNMAKEAAEDPKRFAAGQVKETIIGALIIPILILVLFFILLFILSYTHLLGGPFGIARFLFWLLVIVYAIGGSAIYVIYSTLRKAFTKSPNSPPSGDSHRVRDAEVVDK